MCGVLGGVQISGEKRHKFKLPLRFRWFWDKRVYLNRVSGFFCLFDENRRPDA